MNKIKSTFFSNIYYRTLLILILTVIIITTGCAPSDNNDTKALDDTIASLESSISELETDLSTKEADAVVKLTEKDMTIGKLESDISELSAALDAPVSELMTTGPILNNSLISEAITVMDLISTQDATGLNLHVSPTQGVRFTAYPYVDPGTDMVFYAGSTVPTLFTDNTVYLWGTKDGSGDPITGDFTSYYSDYVYTSDFVNCDIIGINTSIGTGNTMNNLTTSYPGASFVEFHFTGFDPQYGGMDWQSLTLVFEYDSGYWYLIGVIHGQWTI